MAGSDGACQAAAGEATNSSHPPISRQPLLGVLEEIERSLRWTPSDGRPFFQREVNQADRTGLEVPPGDPAALRAAMQRLAGDPALRARLGTAGRRRVEERFTLAGMVRAHLELYEELRG